MDKQISKLSKKNIIGILFSILFLYLIIKNLDVKIFCQEIINFNYFCLFTFIFVYILNQFLKGMRYRLLLNNNNLSPLKSFFIFSTGNALNICFPCRFGDLWKAFHVGEFLKMPKSEALGVGICERLMDFISVILILIFITFKYLKNELTFSLIKYSFLFLGLFFVFILLIYFMARIPLIQNFLSNIIIGLRKFGSFKMLVIIFLYSLLVRLIEAVLIYILIIGCGLHIGFSAALFVIVFNALAGVIPSISSYIGAYQYSYILALGLYDVSSSSSFAIVTIYEFITLSVLGIISLIYFLKKYIKTC